MLPAWAVLMLLCSWRRPSCCEARCVVEGIPGAGSGGDGRGRGRSRRRPGSSAAPFGRDEGHQLVKPLPGDTLRLLLGGQPFHLLPGAMRRQGGDRLEALVRGRPDRSQLYYAVPHAEGDLVPGLDAQQATNLDRNGHLAL